MNEVLKTIRCKQVDCPIATTGICLEGIIETCSFKILEGSNESTPNSNEGNDDNKANYQKVYSADVLKTEDCGKITSASQTRLIILAGSIKAGKTTLLASIMQLFQQKGSFASFLFKSSLTLIGFEKRCFKSRTASMESKADTDRTVYKEEGEEFLHLQVRDANRKVYDLLFTDLSGERFKAISNSTPESKKFVIAKRADHFVLFIDADQISDSSQRQQCRISSINILKGLVDAEMLNPKVYIQVIFSRWDLLLKKGNFESHNEFITLLKTEITTKFKPTFPNLTFHEIASRPENDEQIAFGYGVDQIFPKWIDESPFIPTEQELANATSYKGQSKRQFGKY